MTIQAVIFDFGGVLMRTEDPSSRRKWEEQLGLPDWGLARALFESDSSVRAMRGELAESEVWRTAAEQFRLTPQQLEALQHDFWTGDRLDRELVRFLEGLRPRYRTAILSNAWTGSRHFFEQLGLDNVVDTMVISAEEGVIKPEPRTYCIACTRLDIRPEEAVFVDDLPENVAGAEAIGMSGVHFKNREQALAEVKAYLDAG